MEVAGFSTGVVMAAKEADGKRSLLNRTVLCAAPLDRAFRLRSAPVGYLRAAPVGYSIGRLRASDRRSDGVAPHRRLVPASTSLAILPAAPVGYLRSAPVGYLRAGPVGYLRAAPVGYSTGRIRASEPRSDCAAPHRRLVPASRSFFPSAPMDYNTDRIRPASHRPACAAEGYVILSADEARKVAGIVAMFLFLQKAAILREKKRSNVKRILVLLGLMSVSLWVGFMCIKGEKWAVDIVGASEKGEKVWKIISAVTTIFK